LVDGKGLMSVQVLPPSVVLNTPPLFPDAYPTLLLGKASFERFGAVVPAGKVPRTCQLAPLFVERKIFEVRLAGATENELKPTTKMVSRPTVLTSLNWKFGLLYKGSKVVAVSVERYRVPAFVVK
jgi:hypothetical protein